MPTVSMRELTQLDSGKSTMRYLPPKDTAGFAVFCVSAYKREPRPPARIIATISFAITLFSPFASAPPSVRGENQLAGTRAASRRVCGPPYSSAGFSALGLRPRLAGAFFSAFSAFSALVSLEAAPFSTLVLVVRRAVVVFFSPAALRVAVFLAVVLVSALSAAALAALGLAARGAGTSK